MKYLILISTLLILLSGCLNARKIANWCEKHPEECKSDTIKDTLEVIRESIHYDTAFKYKIGDTLILEKERVKVRTIIKHDTIFQDVEIPSDSIYVPFEVIVDKIAPTEYVKFIPWYIYVIGCLMLAAILGLIFRK